MAIRKPLVLVSGQLQELPAGDSVSGVAVAGAIGSSGLTMQAARLAGRTTAGTGAIEEISVGTGLTLSAGTLSATGGSGGALVEVAINDAIVYPSTSNLLTLGTGKFTVLNGTSLTYDANYHNLQQLNSKYVSYGSNVNFGNASSMVSGGQIIYDGTRWIAFVPNVNPAVYTSSDGIVWTARSVNGATIAYATLMSSGSLIVLSTGSTTLFYTSADGGATWTTRTTNGPGGYYNGWMQQGIWNGTRFVLGNSNAAPQYYSTDGITWSAGATNLNQSSYICWSGTKFATVGFSGGYGYSYVSTDGITFTNATQVFSNGKYALGIVFGSSYFLILDTGGNVYRSTDGITWSNVATLPYTLTYQANQGGLIFASGYFWMKVPGNLIYSADGVTWNVHTTTPTNSESSPSTIAYNGTYFLMTQSTTPSQLYKVASTLSTPNGIGSTAPTSLTAGYSWYARTA